MRVWDVHPGYLARQQLLGEHRELHGLASILIHNKRGYANHPETKRWVGYLPALAMRHRQLACEMALRGYQDRSPFPVEGEVVWPEIWIDPPNRQFESLREKYSADGRSGRISLPSNTQQLWAQHKYSVMASDPKLYSELGGEVAHGKYVDDMEGLALLLITTIRIRPTAGRLHNALLHMWGYVSEDGMLPAEDDGQLLLQVQQLAKEQERTYLLTSTALSDLAVWC
ncbi:DUF1722 domain-containing protein [Pseudomonadota bacterium]